MPIDVCREFATFVQNFVTILLLASMKTQKEPVRLRTKKLANGSESIYLDIYINGRREYEFLKLYLVAEKTRADKERNAEVWRLANAVKSKRIVDIQNEAFGFQRSTVKVKMLDYFDTMAGRKKNESTFRSWRAVRYHLVRFLKGRDVFVSDVTEKMCLDFRDYLVDLPLSTNTKFNYFSIFRSFVLQAYKDKLIRENPLLTVKRTEKEESKRMFLTLEELKKLADTPCSVPNVKRAFLFSALTGLRCSDVKAIRWKDVFLFGEYTRIMFRQKKTKGQEYLDISPQAAELMGERGKDDDFIFVFSTKGNLVNKMLEKWCSAAGISKHITFHCARHSFAVMMLDLGTDIYTVSKLLGHRELSTTQIYAKILDKNKQEAVKKIPSIFDK